MPDDPRDRYELLEGRLIRMSPVGFDHGRTVTRLLFLLEHHLQDTRDGIVVTEVGFELASNPDTVFGPDVAFVRSDRVPARGARGFVKGPPDAVLEVLSPDDRPSETRRKIAEYLKNGVTMVVVIDPEETSVTTFRRSGPSATLRDENDRLDLGEVIPGFQCSLKQIFE